MSETIILAIIVCSCISVVTLIITIGVLIYNYHDNKNLDRSYQLLETDISDLDTRVDLLEARYLRAGERNDS